MTREVYLFLLQLFSLFRFASVGKKTLRIYIPTNGPKTEGGTAAKETLPRKNIQIVLVVQEVPWRQEHHQKMDGCTFAYLYILQ